MPGWQQEAILGASRAFGEAFDGYNFYCGINKPDWLKYGWGNFSKRRTALAVRWAAAVGFQAPPPVHVSAAAGRFGHIVKCAHLAAR
jgi:hypothetical protein